MNATTLPVSARWYRRIDHGAIIEYRMHVNNCSFATELFRGQVRTCSCHLINCQHGRVAVSLEQQYQEEHRDTSIGSCMCCGFLAKIVDGIAICPRCLN